MRGNFEWFCSFCPELPRKCKLEKLVDVRRVIINTTENTKRWHWNVWLLRLVGSRWKSILSFFFIIGAFTCIYVYVSRHENSSPTAFWTYMYLKCKDFRVGLFKAISESLNCRAENVKHRGRNSKSSLKRSTNLKIHDKRYNKIL